MALELSKTLSSDAVGNYWKILNIIDDRKYLRASVSVGLFKDVSSKDKQPLHVFGYSFSADSDSVAGYPFTIEALSAEDMNHVKLAYTALKALPEFAGAIDV